MKKYRSERKGRRNFDTGLHYNTLDMIAREVTRTAKAAVRATGFTGYAEAFRSAGDKLAKTTP